MFRYLDERNAVRLEELEAQLAAEQRPPRPTEQVRMDRWRVRHPADFRDYFERHRQDGHPVVDVSPIYSHMSMNGFRELKATFPDARFLILLRDPIDRLLSLANHISAKPNDQSDDPSEILELLERLLHQPDFNNRYNFVQVPQLFRDLRCEFGSETVMMAYTERLRTQPLFDAICDFIGCQSGPVPSFEAPNKTGPKLSLDPARHEALIEAYADTYALARRELGRPPPNWRR